MIRVGVVGLGKMGLSHLVDAQRPPRRRGRRRLRLDRLPAASSASTPGCGPSPTSTRCSTRSSSTPSSSPRRPILHAAMVRPALERGLHVFCEKPLCLDPAESVGARRSWPRSGAWSPRSATTTASSGPSGRSSGCSTPAPSARSPTCWPRPTARSCSSPRARPGAASKAEGGGCLYDYAAHPLNLLTWYFGEPGRRRRHGARPGLLARDRRRGLSHALLPRRRRRAQLSVNWCDESQRKMTTRSRSGARTAGSTPTARRCQVYLRDDADRPRRATGPGWNVRYTTELTDPVWFYLRGEEYSAQLDAFVQRVAARRRRRARTTSPARPMTDRRDRARWSTDAARARPTPVGDAGEAVARRTRRPAAHGRSLRRRRTERQPSEPARPPGDPRWTACCSATTSSSA